MSEHVSKHPRQAVDIADIAFDATSRNFSGGTPVSIIGRWLSPKGKTAPNHLGAPDEIIHPNVDYCNANTVKGKVGEICATYNFIVERGMEGRREGKRGESRVGK